MSASRLVPAAALLGLAAACSGAPGRTGSDAGPPIGSDAVATVCPPPGAPASFQTFKIGDAAATGGHPVVTFGPDGAPIVVFVVGEAGQQRIVAARLDAVDAGDPPDIRTTTLSAVVPAATPPAVAAMRDGIAVAYVGDAGGTDYARYVTWAGRLDAVPLDVAPTADAAGTSTPALVVDANDRPVMTMLYPDLSMRLLSSSAENLWSRATVALAVIPTEATRIVMALDALARPALVGTSIDVNPYSNATPFLPSPNGLTVWRQADGGWTMDRLLVNEVALAPRIRLSPAGELTLFYFSEKGFGRAVLRDGDWRFDDPVVDSGGRTVFGGMPDVAFGPRGDLRVASLAEHGMTQAVFDGCAWSETVIDAAADGPSIAVDATGRSHIVYERPPAGADPASTVANEVWYARSRP